MAFVVREPIILLGTGRCGSTLTQRLMSRHPSIAWLSGLANAHSSRPWLNGTLMRAIDAPLLGDLAARLWPPREVPPFWEAHCKGFSEPFRDLVADDVTLAVQRRLPAVFARALTARRQRLLLKITGWPRIGFLDRIFPDARFVHVVRDGRAVVNSLLQVGWWWGWRGPSNWRYGPLDPDDEATWLRNDRSFAALAALQWNMVVTAVERARAALPAERLLTLRYEDLCADTAGAVRRLCRFAQLTPTARFEADVSGFPVRSANDKWRLELTVEQQRIITDIMAPRLEHYGYR